MASFVGTYEEFRRYIGPRLRNLVNQITKNHKAEASKCKHCGETTNLESAHVKGRGRNELIDIVLAEFSHKNIVTIDLDAFEKRFLLQHEPFEKNFLILCRPCHRKYDSRSIMPGSNISLEKVTANITKDIEKDGLLPIYLIPSNPNDFKNQFLISGLAEIRTTYTDGSFELKLWNKNGFKQSSNVLGNLRSRPEFRNGKWQSKQIKRVDVTVKKNGF